MQNGVYTNGNAKPSKKLHFIIVGGSLGGLSTGLALRDLGHDTTILERNPGKLLHNQGAGIVAGGDSLAFLKKYNRCDRPVAVTSEKRQYYNRDGEVVHERVMTQNMTSWDLMYYLMRANYDGVESEYCEVPEPLARYGRAVHLHGHKVVSFELKVSGGVRVFYVDSRIDSNDQSEQHMDCDVLIAADGPSSTIRSKIFPNVERTYTGYCALRGTVPENEVTPDTLHAFRNRFAFFHAPSIQILAYLIPGPNGTVVPGTRLINFVYYTNFPSDSVQLSQILTDKSGKRHRITMPPGATDPEAWDIQKRIAREKLPPQFAEIVCATKMPFVQAITDVISPANTFDTHPDLDRDMDRVVLIGDALAGFRPHTVASTSQACFDAMKYAEYIDGRIGREEWKKETMGYARYVQAKGVEMGVRSQFGGLELEELIRDRDEMSRPLGEVEWPEWATRLD